MSAKIVHHDPARPTYGHQPGAGGLFRAATAREHAEAVRDVCARDIADILLAGVGEQWRIQYRLEDYRHHTAALTYAESVYAAELDRVTRR